MKKQTILQCIFIFSLMFMIVNNYKEKRLKENFINTEIAIELAIYINEEETNTIPSKESGYYYDREKSTCSNGAYINWDSVSWSPVVQNMNEYKTRCELHFTTRYTEGILNGTDPVVKEELVPVTIENNGTVRKANLESEWYSYEKKNWANAVILDDQYDTLNTESKVHGATKEEGYVSFDGVDDYIDLGLENYDFGSEITLMARVKINRVKEEIVVPDKIAGNAEVGGFSLECKPDNTVGVSAHINGDYRWVSSEYETAQWYTMIGVYDGKNIQLYIDGKLVNQMKIEGTITISPVSFLLGANPQPNGNHYEYGNIDISQAAIYKRAISEEEVKSLNEGKVINSEGLLRYVDFTNKSYEANEIIPEEKIESYFVWIPKYRYQLWDLGQYDSLTALDTSKVHEIPIIFGDYNTSDSIEGECTTPMESGATGNCTVGDYMTHPAFLSIPSTGFWVGKFETGYNGATNTAEAQANVNDPSKIIIKPNTYSWRNIQAANAFYTSYDYKRELDSHMMKNTEWGAVAYLQHSIYGSSASVRINNNSSYITGYQANNEPTCGYTGTNEECNQYCNDGSCNTSYPNSELASTTGNITGIYDMSGGSWEYVMGVMVDEEGNPMSGRNSLYNSGFNGSFSFPSSDASLGNDTSMTTLTDGVVFPEEHYYDKYAYNSENSPTHYYLKILGDATGEMGPFANITYGSESTRINSWHNDESSFVNNIPTWFCRGGRGLIGTNSGVFAFARDYGDTISYFGFRIILTPIGGAS